MVIDGVVQIRPAERFLIGADFVDDLSDDEIIMSSVWTITGPDALLVVGSGLYAPTNVGTVAGIYVTGGTDGANYTAQNVAQTNANPPQTFVRTLKIRVRA